MTRAQVWFSCGDATCYVGYGASGIEWKRHGYPCRPGLYSVRITGWGEPLPAVVDDYGTLVEVS